MKFKYHVKNLLRYYRDTTYTGTYVSRADALSLALTENPDGRKARLIGLEHQAARDGRIKINTLDDCELMIIHIGETK